MKNITTLAGLCLALLTVANASALDLQPIPAPLGAPVPYAPPVTHAPPLVDGVPVQGPVHFDAAPVPLFTRVKYVDRHEMHPCSVTKIIRVNDPCDDGCDSCCGPQCVYIQICVPPCGCETVRCRRRGDRVRYDYGKYKVDVRVKKGFIVVDYQD